MRQGEPTLAKRLSHCSEALLQTDDFDQEYEQFLKALGARIRDLRQKKELTYRDMIVLHGYHESQWRRYERTGSINLQSLLRIAKVFGTSLSGVLDGLGEYPEVSIAELKNNLASVKRGAKAATSPDPR